jgi:dihydrofolate reductase
MSKIIVWMQVSVDGYVEGPIREFDWPVVRDELFEHFNAELRAAGTFLYGRKVYEMMTGFWPTADGNPTMSAHHVAFARLWKAMPKMVFTRTLDRADWNTKVVKENIPAVIAELKRQPGGDHVLFGGAKTIETFMRHGLIDEFQLFVHPVVLGGGTPLFGKLSQRWSLQLLTAKTFEPGVVALRYQTTGGK